MRRERDDWVAVAESRADLVDARVDSRVDLVVERDEISSSAA